jgi:hypothetical protein
LHPRHSISDAPNEIVLLKAAVKKRSRKGVKTAVFRDLRCPGEPQAVAVPASILLAKGDLPQEPLQGIRILPHDPESLLTGIGIERIEAPFVLRIGMNVRIEKVAADVMTFLSQYPQRIDGAWCATDMQQYFLSQFTNQILCEGAS